MSVIEVNNLTKDYGHSRGIYDISLYVNKGETLGFLGPNGAGKSTTMRHLMGFSSADSGTVKIDDMDCKKNYAKILKNVGYLPGEVALPEGLTGQGFLKMMEGLRGVDVSKVEELLKLFPVNLKSNISKMSIGEKRKLAVIAAFMNDPEIYLLDEPTSGLDPIMQEIFIEFILEEKKKGKTILLSSHIFSEVEALCDRIQIIKDGKIVSIVDAADVKHGLRKMVELGFTNEKDFYDFQYEGFEIVDSKPEKNNVSIVLEDKNTNEFLTTIVKYDLNRYLEKPASLEDFFMNFYKNERVFGGTNR